MYATLVLRSTVYPGVTRNVERLFERAGVRIDVAFCPERIAEGKAMVELFELPQIVASRSPRALERAGKLFRGVRRGATRVDDGSPTMESSPRHSLVPPRALWIVRI